MDEMLKAVSRFPNGTYLKIEWAASGLLLGGTIDTVYQTDNGMPERTSSFREFYAFAFHIKDVLKNESGNAYNVNSLMEVSTQTLPSRITLENDVTVWELA